MKRHLFCSVAVVTLVAGASPTAFAADAKDAPAGAAAQPASDTGVGEIVVRAQRVEQSLQKVPVAVTPVTGAALETRRLHDLTQITAAVPSLEITTDNAFTMRGVGSQIFSDNVDSSVGVMVDDVSLGVPLFMSNGAFVDVQQVEALTGPQGLLFGRNTSAGLLNIISNKPVLGKLGGEASLEFDDRDAAPGGHFGLVATGVLNVPISANSALRLNVLESVQDPIAAIHIAPGDTGVQAKQKRTMIKAKYLWEPTSDLSVYVVGDYSRERGVGGIWDGTYRSAGAGGADLPATLADGCTPSPSNLCLGADGADFRSVNTGGIAVHLSYKLSPDLTLSNILAWRAYSLSFNYDVDLTSAPILDTNAKQGTYNQYSDELRLAVKSGKIDGQVGIFAFASNDNGTAQFDGTGGSPFAHLLYGTNSYHLTDRSLAAYSQFSYHLTDQFQVLAGARVTNDQVSVNALADNYGCLGQPFGPNGPCLPFVNIFGPANQNYSASHTNTNFSYKLGLQYDVTPSAMLYLTIGTGYKGPAMATNLTFSSQTDNQNPATGQNPYILPETVKDLEGGIKATLFDRKLRLNLAGFLEKFSNFQTQAFTSAGNTYLGNAGGVRSIGLELNATARPTSALTLNYTATLLDSHFTDFATDACYVGQTTNGCTTSVFFQGAGLSTPTTAHFHHTFEAQYEVPLGTSDKLIVEGNWYHRSSLNFQANAAPFSELGAIDTFGASLAYKNDKGLSFSIFCKNCTNKLVPTYISSDPGDAATGVLSVFQRWDYNSVRTIGASVGVKF